MNQYQIVLADDHALLRQGLKKIIDERSDLSVVGDVGDGLSLLRLLRNVSPDMVILDISMPNLRGIEATGEIKKMRPPVKVLVLTMHKDIEFLNQAFSAGADGYLLKESADVELFVAIEKIRNGRTFVSPQLLEMLAEDWTHLSHKANTPDPDHESLTARERQVLKMMAEGKTSKEIGDLLFISARTVDHHRANIMNKLRLKKTADLIRYALYKGYA